GPLGLETDKTKQHALKEADAAGAMFMSFFSTFGSFSIAAGILLIFLIFVMLAAERRGALGIARAAGGRRARSPPRGGNPARAPRADVRLRGDRLRSRRRCGRSARGRRRRL